jgi:predicted amidohydrolase YtcJ
MMNRRRFLEGGAAVVAAAQLGVRADLDVALVRARLWTGTGREQTAPGSVGIVGNRIAAVGNDAVRARTARTTRIIDLDGAFVMPAFIDNHTHFLRGAAMLSQPNLRDAANRQEFIRRIAAAAQETPPGRWVEGGYWDEQLWGGELPSRQWIDDVTANVPVAVVRLDLHMVLLNSVALRLAGIDRNSVAPEGGVIVRDAAGEPTGILKDKAAWLAQQAIPRLSDAQSDEILRQGITHGLSKGVAQVHVPEIDWTSYQALRRLRAKGETGMRFYAFVPLGDWEKMAAIVAAEGHGDDWVRWGGVKGLMDGSLGSRTALFHEPYLDAPGQHGIRVEPRQEIHRLVAAADRHGLQVTVHAIGDEANDDILDIYAAVEKTNGRRDRRFRVEHAQHLSENAISRFARQKVIASVQPYHAVDDGRWAVRRIRPRRLHGTYAFRALMNTGATVTFGSDWPVAPLDPLTGVHAAVTRATIDGANPGGWLPGQKVSVEQALGAYTTANAYAGFQENRLGRIAAGYLADLTVLDRDLRSLPPADILQAKVLRTWVDGRERFGPDAG